MANATLATALQATRDNLIAITAKVFTENAKTFSYAAVEGATYPITQFFITNTQRQKLDQDRQQFTVNARMVVTVERFLAGYDGQPQDVAQWTYLPTLLQGFEEYSGLAYPVGTYGGTVYAGAGTPAYLDTINTGVNSSQFDVQGQNLILIFNWSWIYITTFARKC